MSPLYVCTKLQKHINIFWGTIELDFHFASLRSWESFSFLNQTSLCKKIVQKFQKIVSKSCFNFTFSTILACQALLADNKSTVQIWRNILEYQKCTIFDEISCLALPIKSYLVRFGKICLATASRLYSTSKLNTL